MKKRLAILLFDDVEDLDFCGPLEVFSVADRFSDLDGFEVITVAQKRCIRTCNGLSVNVDFVLTESPAIDLLLVPGGIGTRRLLTDETLLDWIRATACSAQMVLSVCTGSLVLGKAGLLNGLDVTTHHTAFDLLRDMVPSATVHRDKRFVDNRTLVTSAGIAAGIDMSLHVVGRLLSDQIAQRTACQMEYPYDVTVSDAARRFVR